MATAPDNDLDDTCVGDIELVINSHHDSGVGSSTSPTPSTTTSSRNNVGKIHNLAAEGAFNLSTASELKSIIDSLIFAIKYILFCMVSLAIYLPFFQLSMLIFYCSSSRKLLGPNWCSGSLRTKSGVYNRMNEFETPKNKVRRKLIVTTSRLGCLICFWLVVNLCVPSLRKATLFGCPLWKWSLLATLLSLGYPCTYTTVTFFRVTFVNSVMTNAHERYYYVAWGLINDTLASMLYFVWILLVWVLYFRTKRGLNLDSRHAVDFTTWTLVSLLVGAVLWVVKRVVMLQWMANAIHKRFKARILMAGFQLFFLSTIIDGLRFRYLVPCWFEDDDEKTALELACMGRKSHRSELREEKDARSILKGRNILDYMLSKNASLQQINVIAGYVADLAEVEPRGSDNNILEIVKRYRRKIGADNESAEYVTEETIRNWLKDDEAGLLIAALLAEFPTKTIDQVPFLKWMVAAHKNCVSLGYTLIDAYSVVHILDMILTCCIVIIVALLWLLVTELATTKVLIVIASPFLAFTYIFGDTCMKFFQGVVFSFVTHPFDVGDRCIIDGVEVEVKRISILTTTCIKIGTKEKMLYPNSDLATKIIINHESKHDPTDLIELSLDPDTSKSQILRLRRCIRNFLGSNNQRKFYQESCRVIVKEIGESIKMSIHFKHTLMDVHDLSHSEFFQKKKRQRSNFFIKIKQFLEDLKIKIAQS